MIRGLIVDDEKITRKGMLSVIPWARFGIEIVEDVASGAAALSFMMEHTVDLVFVDVAMPGMNGIELIREMRARGMECAVVVLTFYDDFEYVQEAMRLGAVDYLLKTHLDDRKILDMLGRVTGLLGRSDRVRGTGAARPAFFALVDPRGTAGPGAEAAADELAAVARLVARLQEGSIVLSTPPAPQVEEQVLSAAARHGVTAVRLVGVAGPAAAGAAGVGGAAAGAAVAAGGAGGAGPTGAVDAPPDLQALNDAALRSIVYYEHGPAGSRLVIPCERLREKPAAMPPGATEELRDRFASPGWLFLEAPFRELEEMTCRLRPPVEMLEALVTSAATELAAAFPSLAGTLGEALAIPGTHRRTWADWRELLQSARGQGRTRVLQARHSEDTVRKVLEGLDVIGKSAGRYVKEEAVAARVGLSRTYFSRCFKDITGVEFKKFLLDKSIMEAKGLLIRTAEPFRSISARLGYQSEAHFSRTFRSLTGFTPREFRTHNQPHNQPPNRSQTGDRH